VPPPPLMAHHHHQRLLLRPRGGTSALDVSSSSSSSSSSSPASLLSVRDMKEQLRVWGIKSDDCFDKESLIIRYQEAQQKIMADQETSSSSSQEKSSSPSSSGMDAATATTTSASSSSTSSTSTAPSTKSPTQSTYATSKSSTNKQEKLDKQAVLTELRGMRVKELRGELAARGKRWAGLLEKEDLVQAVWQARAQAATFSATGLITPGEVATLAGDQIQQEASDKTVSTPLVVDAYAVWCGPCQMMAPQLQAAAATWGDAVRVAKFDTDQYPQVASQYRVQGLPTLLLFHGGRELARIEGALMKDQLVQWVQHELDKAGRGQ